MFRDKNIENVFLSFNSSFIQVDNKIYCFGRNLYGQLGLGDYIDNKDEPVENKYINFNKFYVVKMGGKFQGMREINYSGNISFYEREITAQGKYEISGTSSNFDGTWDMKSVSK